MVFLKKALECGGLSYIKLQLLILTLRTRTVHTCDLENVCVVVEINFEFTSMRNYGHCRVEHYPHNTIYEESYNLVLV